MSHRIPMLAATVTGIVLNAGTSVPTQTHSCPHQNWPLNRAPKSLGLNTGGLGDKGGGGRRNTGTTLEAHCQHHREASVICPCARNQPTMPRPSTVMVLSAPAGRECRELSGVRYFCSTGSGAHLEASESGLTNWKLIPSLPCLLVSWGQAGPDMGSHTMGVFPSRPTTAFSPFLLGVDFCSFRRWNVSALSLPSMLSEKPAVPWCFSVAALRIDLHHLLWASPCLDLVLT